MVRSIPCFPEWYLCFLSLKLIHLSIPVDTNQFQTQKEIFMFKRCFCQTFIEIVKKCLKDANERIQTQPTGIIRSLNQGMCRATERALSYCF